MIFCSVTCFQWVSAHPGVGIVGDSRGNIYYTDLKQVWKIDRHGKKNVAVPKVHSHELYMDADDNLFGEHLWYNGEGLNTWGHYVWCLKSDGSLVKVKEASEGFLENYSFVRDLEGNMYWAEKWKVSRIRKKSPDGVITTLAEGKFKDIRWLHASPGGNLYFTDLTDLYKIDTTGKLTLIAKSLEEKTTLDRNSLRHHIFGIWLDRNDNIYLAVTGGKVVKKITPAGVVTKFLFSTGGWSPTGGVFDDDDNLWLLETNALNQTRVRKIPRQELLLKDTARTPWLKYSVGLFAVAVITFLLIRTMRNFLTSKNELTAR